MTGTDAPGSSHGGPSGRPASSGRFAELPVRIVSAVILAALVVYCVWAGGGTYQLLVSVAAIIVWYEFNRITNAALPMRVGFAGTVFLLMLVAALYGRIPFTGVGVTTAGVLLIAGWEYLVRRSLWGAAGLAYAGYFLVSIALLREGEHGVIVILFLAACVWGSDTFAYFAGKLIGGPKLAPRISPNKTWSGFAGGFAGAIVLTSLLMHLWQGAVAWSGVLLAIGLAFFSQIGDLAESWLKRRFGVKDSSRIIPGHGGLMDRIDGLVFAGIAMFVTGYALAPGEQGLYGIADTLFARFLAVN